MNLGNKIKEIRKRRGISQEVLAEHLGVTFQAVSKWEVGATMLYILADHYTAQGDTDKAIIQLEIARNVLNSFESDFATQYTRSAYDPEEIENINKRITDLKCKK